MHIIGGLRVILGDTDITLKLFFLIRITLGTLDTWYGRRLRRLTLSEPRPYEKHTKKREYIQQKGRGLIKKDPRRKIDSNFALRVFSKKESYVVHIFLYTTRNWNRQVIPDRVVQSVSGQLPVGSFVMASHKSCSCLWLFPLPPCDNFKPPTSLPLQVQQI